MSAILMFALGFLGGTYGMAADCLTYQIVF